MRIFYILLSIAGILVSCTTDKGFSVSKEKISKIVLSDKEACVSIEKKQNTWLIDGYIPTNSSMITNLLEIVSRINTEYPVPLAQEQCYTKELFDDLGLKIQIYKGDKQFHSYSLLFEEGKTIGMLEGMQQAYYVYMPGEDINLSEYLSSNPFFWQDNLLFNSSVADLVSVKIINYNEPEQSFLIEQSEEGKLDLTGITKKVDFEVDSTKLRRYLSYFTLLHFDHFASNLEKNKVKEGALFRVSLKTNKQGLTFDVIPINDDRVNEKGEALLYNRDYFFLKKENEEIMVGEWIGFDILLKKLDDFKK